MNNKTNTTNQQQMNKSQSSITSGTSGANAANFTSSTSGKRQEQSVNAKQQASKSEYGTLTAKSDANNDYQ